MEKQELKHRLNLQFYAEGADGVDDDSIMEEDIVEDDDIEDVDDVEEDIEDEDDAEEDDDLDVKGDKPKNPDLKDKGDKEKSKKSLFTPEQQQHVNEIVKARLDRAKAQWNRELSRHAGIELSETDVAGASRLWGLLASNPELSDAVENVIQQYLANGQAKHPTSFNSLESKEQELAVREAILDLKASDKTFRKHQNEIMEWAEEQGFAITDKKSLEIAYMAWQGANSKLLRANEALREQQKNAAKSKMKRRASVESGSSGSRKSKIDYTKMSDTDILAAEGLSLFTED